MCAIMRAISGANKPMTLIFNHVEAVHSYCNGSTFRALENSQETARFTVESLITSVVSYDLEQRAKIWSGVYGTTIGI